MNQSTDVTSSRMAAAPPQSATGRKLPLKIGLGCFGALVMGCLFIVGMLVIGSIALRSSDAYQLALAAAQRDPSVTAELGAPIRAGWLTTGQINTGVSTGEASLQIPISGPRGSGTIAVHANKSGGNWSVDSLNVRIAGRPTPLDLLASSPP